MVKYRQAEFLKPDDCIGIVSTARKITPEQLEPAIKTIKELGYRVKTGKNIFAEKNQFAGDDDLRAADLQQMIDDDSVKAILCARGGYGSVRIIDKIDFSSFNENPVWICGFSDVTVLHSHLHEVLKCKSIHSAMPSTFPTGGETYPLIAQMFKTLGGEPPQYSFPPHQLNRNGGTSGIICGGNLSILYSLNGSVSDINTDNKILFIEDLDEYLYHIDRMMINLKRAGKLDKLKALLVGGMSDMRDNTVAFGKTAEEIIAEAVEEYSYPLIFNFPAGHIENNMPLVFGDYVELVTQNDKPSSLITIR